MSKIVVLDTHVWFWFINREFDRFPSRWKDIIETAPCVGVSSVSCYEIVLAHKKGRLSLPCKPVVWLKEALEPTDIELFPLTPEIAALAVDLSPVHKDPFDRIIIATAIDYDADLATLDRTLREYPEIKAHLLP